MEIESYIINDCWLSRLSDDKPILTVYDPEGVYKGLIAQAQEYGFTVADTSRPIMESYLLISKLWDDIKEDPHKRILIYRPVKAPTDEFEKRNEPYQSVTQTGMIFPIGANDTLLNIAHRFLPSKSRDIDELERNGSLSFDNINNLQEGASYPILESLTHGHSLQEIVIGLLKLPTVTDLRWLSEWKKLVKAHFTGIDFSGTPTLREVQDRMWQYLLFSEFVFDLPDALPENLISVPRASDNQKTFIYELNRRIRNSLDIRDNYIEAANDVARKLNLDELFSSSPHLGEIVTFAFENRVESERFVKYLESFDIQEADILYEKNKKSIWYSADRNVYNFWNIAFYALKLYEAIAKGADNLTSRKEILDWYVEEGYKADSAYRNFLIQFKQTGFSGNSLRNLTDLVERNYNSFTDRIVKLYQESTDLEGCIPGNLEVNLGAFERLINPKLKEGKRIVMIMADAFRYEMGKEFQRNIKSNYPEIECYPALAYLPTVTRFGMAALLPEAENDLNLKVMEGILQPFIKDKLVAEPKQRIEKIKEFLGDNYKVEDFTLEQFNPSFVYENTSLLVIRSTKIDTSCESCDSIGLGTMELEVRSLIQKIDQVKNLGFDEVYIFADHGYMLKSKFTAGDKIPKPLGNDIVLSERRCIAGNLNESGDTLQFTPTRMGIKATFPKLAFAKGLGVFETGKSYFHEGLSLQENVVPIVHIKLSRAKKEKKAATFRLTYKGMDSGTVRIFRPMIGIEGNIGDIFGEDIKVKMMIHNAAGAIAGQVVESDYYDESTGVLSIPPATEVKQPIELNEDLVGDIVITLLDLDTNVTMASLVLHTDLNR